MRFMRLWVAAATTTRGFARLTGTAAPSSQADLAAVFPWNPGQPRDEIVSHGGKTIVSGTLATCISGSVVGVLY